MKKKPVKKTKKSVKSSKKSISKKTGLRTRYSPRQQQVIENLADMVGKIIPATSRGPFSLQGIAKDRGLNKFFDEKLTSKKKQFEYFISAVHKKHPRMLKSILNDNLAKCIDRRRSQGNPILLPEIEALRDTLFEFGIDLRSEINELKLPTTRPVITPPPTSIVQALEKIGLHKVLVDEVMPLFKNGHINESLRKAGEIMEAEVMRWSAVRGRFGRDLMAHVFNKDNPIIDVSMYHGSEISSPNDEKEGFMMIAMGTMQWCKNIVGHGNVAQLPPHEAASRIILINHLIEVIDTTVKKQAVVATASQMPQSVI